MKKNFEEPFFAVVRFNNSVIATSGCGCNVGGQDFGQGANNICDDAPICTCTPDLEMNCY